jgi:beta-lactam-binding protein with PASTA domain
MQVVPAQIAPKDDVRPPQSVTIPALTGQRYADATQRLQGIAKVERRQRASSRPFDIVIDQSPGASVVPWPATVVLTVSDGSLVVVPRLQNGPLSTAPELLKRQGLSWSVVEQASSAPAGTVIGQAPEPGREVPRGTLVRLTVAKAPSPSSSPASPTLTGPMASMTNPPVAIPRVYVRDYIGAPASVAAAELGSAGLKPQVQSRPSVRPRGEVFDQKPRNVEVTRGTVVDLLASDGSLVVMPSLGGQRIERARALLDRLELRPTFEERPATAPPGTVIDQGIAADTVVQRGSTVRVVVAAAPPAPPAPIVVRDYVGWSANEARADLQRERLQAAIQGRPSSEPRERVVDQMPRNAKVKAGTTVTLVVSDGSRVRVPRVTRLPLPRAEQALQERDLTVQRQRRESDAPAGTVLQQDPAPDTEVARGSAVRVLVAVARPTPPAPPVPSLPSAEPPPSAPPPPTPTPETPLVAEPPPALVPSPEPLPTPVPTPVPVDTTPPSAPPAEPPPPPTGTEPPPATPAAPPPASPPAPTPPTVIRPPPGDGISPWWFAAAGLPFAAAGGWFLRGRVRTPKVREAASGKPSVAAEWGGAAEPPRLSPHEGDRLHIHIDVSGPHAAVRPEARITQEKRDE